MSADHSTTRKDAIHGDGSVEFDSIIETTQVALSQREIISMRIENETLLAEAQQRPRSPAAIIAEVKANLAAYPSLAAKLTYRKPVGKANPVCGSCGEELRRLGKQAPVKCGSCGSKNVVDPGMKYASGLSIRAAEMLAEIYGFNRIKSEVETVDDFHARVTVCFTDFQKGRSWTESGIVSRYYKTGSGQTGVTAEDRFHDVVVKAAKSKLIREAVLRCLPAGLKIEVEAIADRINEEALTDDAVDKIVEFFAGRGVSLDKLERRLGRTRASGWTKADRVLLGGIWSAIEDNETTIAQAFGDLEDRPTTPSGDESKPTVSLGDLQSPRLADTTPSTSPPQDTTRQELPAVDGSEQAPNLFDTLRKELAASRGDPAALTAIGDSYFARTELPESARARIAHIVAEAVAVASRNATGKEPSGTEKKPKTDQTSLLK